MVSLVRLMLFTTTVEILTVRTGIVCRAVTRPLFFHTGVARARLNDGVKRGASIVVPRKIVKIGWDNVFGELLTAVDLDLHSEVVGFHLKEREVY